LAKRATSIVATATTTAANKEPSVVCAPPISNIGQLSMLSSVSNELILPGLEIPSTGTSLSTNWVARVLVKRLSGAPD
jgi:hypothetical protein